MTDDALWYEAALLVGITNALNAVAGRPVPAARREGLGGRHGSEQSFVRPQRGQMILQWISSMRSPQRSQLWTHSVTAGREGTGGGLGRGSMQLVHYIA